MNTINVIFQHDRLRQRRKEKKFTQEMLAELCGCSPRYLRDLELGIKCNPSGALLCRIALVLEIPVEELFAIQWDDLAC